MWKRTITDMHGVLIFLGSYILLGGSVILALNGLKSWPFFLIAGIVLNGYSIVASLDED